jgi:hypothetical protein
MRKIVIAILQMVFGVLVIVLVYTLGDLKAGEPFIPPPGELWTGPQVFSGIEFTLATLGIVITICGYLQHRNQVKYAGLQMGSGLIITITFAVLGIRAATLGYYEHSHLYYYVYLLMIPGAIAAIFGIVQFVRAILFKYRKRDTICYKGEKTS